MPEVKPLLALHYDLSEAGALDDLLAPPYDVIDAATRGALVARSHHNAVELDLPEDLGGSDRYQHAARLLAGWRNDGVLVADSEPALWALEQSYRGPDGESYTRRGFLGRVRVTDYGPGLVRPHERTQPGPKQDRLELTRATAHNLSPIFSLHPGDAWSTLEPALGDPWGEATDAGGTVNRVWRVSDPAAIETLCEELADAELLIADGHHRYETARVYADEVGGEGDHRYTLMCLVSLEDPGLTVFGYHRLLGGFTGTDKPEVLADALREHFEIEEVPNGRLDPAGTEGVGVFGYIDSHLRQGFRLRLKDTARIDELLADRSEAYRRLDAAILEELILKEALGMSAEDVEAKRGIGYAKSMDEALATIDDDGSYQVAFLLRPTPVDQVRAVAAAGETMPPKSTFFFPKVLTGIVFNPL
ncbi:MAG: DUF1015 domain-containing protein [Solirubrobacterales bacterium]